MQFPITPPCLSKGDTIAVISPSSPVKPEYIDGAATLLRERGYKVKVMPHAKGPALGTYAAADNDRLDDLTSALQDPKTKAILCSRGGYGANHLLDGIRESMVRDNPKWLVGFSDISALHALWLKAGVKSLHAPMAKHLTEKGLQDPCTRALLDILETGLPATVEAPGHPLNTQGQAEGTTVGGNLAVINGLAATPFDPMAWEGDIILFIEDIGEQIYEIERMLIRLRLAGAFRTIKGLAVGQFTEYRPNANHTDMESMIADVTAGIPIPKAFGMPFGHVDINYPIISGSRCTLTVSTEGSKLTME